MKPNLDQVIVPLLARSYVTMYVAAKYNWWLCLSIVPSGGYCYFQFGTQVLLFFPRNASLQLPVISDSVHAVGTDPVELRVSKEKRTTK